MKYCHKCGTQLNDDATFCTACGEKLSENSQKLNSDEKPTQSKSSNTFDYKKFLSKALFYIKKAPLIFNGILMFLFSCPLYAHFQNIRLAGIVYNYCNRQEKEIWDSAFSARDTLFAFIWISIILIGAGVAILLAEKNGKIKLSKQINNCLLYIPLALTAIIVLCTYPKIFEYKDTFTF